MAIEITYAFTMRLNYLAVHHNGELEAEISFKAGSATLIKLKTILLQRAGESIFRKQSFPRLDQIEERLAEIRPLAEAGWNLLKCMFGEAGAAEIGRIVDGVPASEGIEVRQNRHWIPWSLTYLRDPAQDVSLEHFMGSKRLLVDVLNSRESTAPSDEQFVERLGRERLGLVDDDELPTWSPNSAERQQLAHYGGDSFDPLYVPGDASRTPPGLFNADDYVMGFDVARAVGRFP